MATSTCSRIHGRTGAAAGSRRLLDAVALLEAHHRRLERRMSCFLRTRNRDRKAELAGKICAAALLHARLEKEVFCPEFLAATGDVETHHQAEVTRHTCVMLIAAFGGTDLRDAHLEARMQVIMEVIRRHIHEEQKHDGIFAAARRAGMDLQGLGHRMRRSRHLLAKGKFRPRPPRHGNSLAPALVAAGNPNRQNAAFPD